MSDNRQAVTEALAYADMIGRLEGLSANEARIVVLAPEVARLRLMQRFLLSGSTES